MDSPEALSPARIRAALTEKLGPALAARFEPWVVAETGSTNSDLLAQGRDHAVAEGRVLFAESQTAGRGRRGDPWVSPPGTNLLFSILLRPGGPIAAWLRLPHLAGIAVCRAIESVLPGLEETPWLKWPNDVFLGEWKVAGILVESRGGLREDGSPAPFAVLGIGLNVNLPPEAFPEDLRSLATSLSGHAGHRLDRNAVAAAFLAEWAALYPAALEPSAFGEPREELRRRSFLTGREVVVFSGNRQIAGTAIDAGPEGELIVEKTDGERETIVSADGVRWA